MAYCTRSSDRPRAVRVIEYLAKSLKLTQGHWKRHHSIYRIGILLAFHSNYGPILYYLRDKARYWLKIAILSYPTCIQRPRRNIAVRFGTEKLQNGVATRRCKKYEDMFTCFDTIHERYGHPDGQIWHDGIGPAYASIFKFSLFCILHVLTSAYRHYSPSTTRIPCTVKDHAVAQPEGGGRGVQPPPPIRIEAVFSQP